MQDRGVAVAPGRLAANLAGLAILGWFFLDRTAPWFYAIGGNGHDAMAYYLAGRDLTTLYDDAWHTGFAYVYSPAFAQFVAPFTVAGWEPFYALWTLAGLAALALLCGPLLAASLLVTWQPVQQEISAGNVDLFVGLAIAAGFRYPGSWAFVLLTKVTPGVGLLWFVVRREWPALVRALAVTGAVVVVSFVLAPGAWVEWVRRLIESPDAIPGFNPYVPLALPLLPRIALGAAIVAWGAWTNRPWAVLVAAFVASPLPTSTRTTMLLGLLPMLGWGPLARLLQRPADEVGARLEPNRRVFRPASGGSVHEGLQRGGVVGNTIAH